MISIVAAMRRTPQARLAVALACGLWNGALLMSAAAAEPRTTGSIERLDPALDALVPADAQMEIIIDGIQWCEGPLWIPQDGGFVICSDIPNNTIRRWDA